MRELVPGDLVALKGGDVIPADCEASAVRAWLPMPGVERARVASGRAGGLPSPWLARTSNLENAHAMMLVRPHARMLQLVGEGEPLKVDESSLTGESLEVTRRPGDKASASRAVWGHASRSGSLLHAVLRPCRAPAGPACGPATLAARPLTARTPTV